MRSEGLAQRRTCPVRSSATEGLAAPAPACSARSTAAAAATGTTDTSRPGAGARPFQPHTRSLRGNAGARLARRSIRGPYTHSVYGPLCFMGLRSASRGRFLPTHQTGSHQVRRATGADLLDSVRQFGPCLVQVALVGFDVLGRRHLPRGPGIGTQLGDQRFRLLGLPIVNHRIPALRRAVDCLLCLVSEGDGSVGESHGVMSPQRLLVLLDRAGCDLARVDSLPRSSMLSRVSRRAPEVRYTLSSFAWSAWARSSAFSDALTLASARKDS